MNLLLDDDATTTLAELIRVNAEPDVIPLTEDDVKRIVKLKPGEETYIETTKIKRID